jgi:hypothetical protein
MMRIYLTHCSREKSLLAKETGELLPPDQLYTEGGVQSFMQRCLQLSVTWAILSDKNGVVFPQDKHPYYEKPPATATLEEENQIRREFEQLLEPFQEIWFYVRPDSFHPFYQRVLEESTLAKRVHLFQDLAEINSP